MKQRTCQLRVLAAYVGPFSDLLPANEARRRPISAASAATSVTDSSRRSIFSREEVVKECNRLGIVVDLAHASHKTVLAALQVTTQPVIVSHTSLDSRTGGNPKMAEMMKPRLISKEHAKVVADAGGVIGVWTHLADSLKDFVESIKAMVDAVGIDHAGIGTDTDLLSLRVGQGTHKAWPGLTEGFFQAVVGEMLLQGFTPDDIGKLGGGNFCRVFGKATAGHA